MKITDVRYAVVYASRRRVFGRPVVTGLGASVVSEYAFVEVHTDEGITGVGECEPTPSRPPTYICLGRHHLNARKRPCNRSGRVRQSNAIRTPLAG